MTKVTGDMLIGDIVKKFPDKVDVLSKHGMHCIGCHVATWETLDQAAQAHGIDVEMLTKELNKEVK